MMLHPVYNACDTKPPEAPSLYSLGVLYANEQISKFPHYR